MSSRAPALLLLDTHYWIWLQLGTAKRFTQGSLDAVRKAAAAGNLLLSVISVWELGMFEAKGQIRLTPSGAEWVREALATPGLTLAPLSAEIALESSRLPGSFHGDPADRIIAATARRMGARLLTRDEKLRDYAAQGHVLVFGPTTKNSASNRTGYSAPVRTR